MPTARPVAGRGCADGGQAGVGTKLRIPWRADSADGHLGTTVGSFRSALRREAPLRSRLSAGEGIHRGIGTRGSHLCGRGGRKRDGHSAIADRLAGQCCVLIGERRVHALLPAEQFVSLPGNFRYVGGRSPLPEPLADRALRIARQAISCVSGLGGYVGVDMVLGSPPDGSRDFVIEINPRLTTSYIGLRTLCEDNLMDGLLRLVRGESLGKPRWRDGQVTWTPEGKVRLGPDRLICRDDPDKSRLTAVRITAVRRGLGIWPHA